MQQNMDQVEKELDKIKEILYSTEKERDNALEQLGSIKKFNVEEAGMKLHEELSIKNFETMKKDLKFMEEELSNRDKLIESLKLDIKKVKKLEINLAEKSSCLGKLKEELSTANTQKALVMELLSEGEKRIRELEAEVEKGKGKEAETKIYDSLMSQTKEYEKTKIMLEEAKLEITSLNKKFDYIDGVEKLGKFGSFEEDEDINSLKEELKRAAVEEENSKKALDDLALALKEVGTESNKVKEKLGLTKAELEYSKGEEKLLKLILKDTEEKYKALLDETKKESELHKNTADRLRIEAEESLMAWTGKETGFVECIRRAEKDFQDVQKEKNRLLDCLYEAENETKTAKEETSKLRDILKQSLNEANVAKEASTIAREENSQLKDTIIEKEDAINFLLRENQNYRMHETAALENINELKRMLFEATMRECRCKSGEKDKTSSDESKENKEAGPSKCKTNHIEDHKEEKEGNNSNTNKGIAKVFSMSIKELIMPSSKHKEEVVVESEIDDTLKGSIFDYNVVDSPVTPEPVKDIVPNHQRKKYCSSLLDEHHLEALHSDELDHLDTHFDELEHERNSRKKKALLRRFGDLIKKKGSHKKEPLMDKKEPVVDKKEPSIDKKEITME